MTITPEAVAVYVTALVALILGAIKWTHSDVKRSNTKLWERKVEVTHCKELRENIGKSLDDRKEVNKER
jgi:hypothetical protein